MIRKSRDNKNNKISQLKELLHKKDVEKQELERKVKRRDLKIKEYKTTLDKTKKRIKVINKQLITHFREE